MASTYSDLKLELMATGEKTGQWGDITNINLGTAIEEAITGSSTVEFSGSNVTLTLVDSNASQSARNLRLNLTGSTSGVRDLIVPAIEKVYIVNNGCPDDITVKNSTGTGITVPAGKTMYVYNDGTNVVDAITHLTSLTLGTPLPVASGGTGASTAGDARTNLGLGTIATQDANNVAITGGAITGITDLAIADGGTGASTAGDARTNLGLGAIATLSSVNNSNWSGTDLAVINGGTGASDAAGAITNLGAQEALVSGTNIKTINGQNILGSGNLNLEGIPAGVIAMWSGSIGTIPSGWALCNGLSGTPDLRNRFVVAAGDTYAVGGTGDGSLPGHSHPSGTLVTNSAGAHAHPIRGTTSSPPFSPPGTGDAISTRGRYSNFTGIVNSAGAHSHSISGSTGSAGTGSAVVAIYYALAYIMKV